MPSVTLHAYAKINLSLRVKGTRADGFHEVQTILQGIDLSDRLRIATRRGPFEIRCLTAGVPRDRGNLVWKAAELLWHTIGAPGEPRDVVVTLDKNIPLQAGLGGGSSDAAAALLGLRRLWNRRVPDSDLFSVAAALGSDVPYFLVGGTALGLGRGEEVFALEELPPLWLVLGFPPFGVSTKDAYGWLDEARSAGRGSGSGPADPGIWARRTVPDHVLVNDLEGPVIERHPLVGAMKQRLQAAGAVMAAMTGSGSTVFGVFKSKATATAAARSLSRDRVRNVLTRFRPRPRG